MEIVYTKDPAMLAKWDEFVQHNDKGCHLLLSDWVNSYRSYGFDAEFCICIDKGEVIGGFAAVIAKVLFLKCYIVPYGPIAAEGFDDHIQMLTLLIPERGKFHHAAYAHVALPVTSQKNNHIYNGLFRVPAPAKAGHHFPYVYSSSGLNWISLKNYADEETILDSFKSSTRRDVRASLRKEMVVKMLETEAEIRDGYALCLANADKHGYALRDWDSFRETLINLIDKGYGKFLSASKDGEMKGAILLVKAGNYYTYILGGTVKEKPDLLPGHLLQWEAIRLSVHEKCDGYNISLGGSKGVLDFKDSFGTEHILFEDSKYHWVLRPTLFGSYRFFEKRMKPYKKQIAKILAKFRR
jgi:hypothetical protein